LSDSDCS